MQTTFKQLLFGALSMVALAGAAKADPNLVTNPGFETGNLTGWTGTGAFVDNQSYRQGVNSGTYAAFFGAVGHLDSISQTVATVAGQAYVFSFYFSSDGATPNEFRAFFDGTQVFESLNAPAFGYTQESYVVTASGASTTISFLGRNDPTYQALDDVSVTATTVPEPATVALLGTGLIALAIRRRRHG